MIQPPDLIPAGLVLVLTLLGSCLPQDDNDAMCPAGTDGPQFACWLQEHPEQLEPDDCFARVGDGQCTGGTEAEVAWDAP